MPRLLRPRTSILHEVIRQVKNSVRTGKLLRRNRVKRANQEAQAVYKYESALSAGNTDNRTLVSYLRGNPVGGRSAKKVLKERAAKLNAANNQYRISNESPPLQEHASRLYEKQLNNLPKDSLARRKKEAKILRAERKMRGR